MLSPRGESDIKKYFINITKIYYMYVIDEDWIPNINSNNNDDNKIIKKIENENFVHMNFK